MLTTDRAADGDKISKESSGRIAELPQIPGGVECKLLEHIMSGRAMRNNAHDLTTNKLNFTL